MTIRCPDCHAEAELKEFNSFSYWYCTACKKEVKTNEQIFDDLRKEVAKKLEDADLTGKNVADAAITAKKVLMDMVNDLGLCEPAVGDALDRLSHMHGLERKHAYDDFPGAIWNDFEECWQESDETLRKRILNTLRMASRTITVQLQLDSKTWYTMLSDGFSVVTTGDKKPTVEDLQQWHWVYHDPFYG